MPKIRTALWAAVHLGALVLFILLPKAAIETDFISIIPKISANRIFEKPLRDFFAASANTVTVFVEADDFEHAKKTAYEIRNFLNGVSSEIRVNLEKSNAEFIQITQMLAPYTYQLMPNSVRADLETGRVGEVAENALASVYSPFFMPLFSDTETDPFLLFTAKMQEIMNANLAGTSGLTQREDVLYTQYNEKPNIFFTFELPPRFTDGNSWVSVVEAFLPYADSLNSGSVNVYTSGVLIHSYYSQKSAEKEITLISIISFIIICGVFLLVFRSLRPFFICMATVILSVGFAYAVSSIIFKSIHIFAFVFGTSLIGITIDYAIHYFSDWFFEKNTAVLRKIFPSLLLGFITTVSGYVVLRFSGLLLLHQMAVFSIAGMCSSFLSVTLVYPLLFSQNPRKTGEKTQHFFAAVLFSYRQFFNRGWLRYALFALLLAAGIFGITKVKTDFSAASMYAIPDFLLKNEIAVNERLNNPAQSDLLFIKGETAEDALILQERLRPLLSGAFMLSDLVPSKKRQAENYELAKTELIPLLPKQLAALGFEPSVQEACLKAFEHEKNNYLTPSDLLNFTMLSELGKLFFKSGDAWISVVPLNTRLRAQEQQYIESLSPDARVFSVQEEIDGALALTVLQTLKYTIIAYVLIFMLILCTIKKRQAFLIMLFQLIAVFFNCAVHGIFGLPLTIFSILALILALGISIDYSIFFAKSLSPKTTVFIGVFLSMLTTLLSFGTLSFSSFIPVQSFALSLFFGIFFSFLLSPLLISPHTVEEK